MGILTDILLFPVIGPIKGMKFIAEKIEEQVEDELYNVDRIRQELMALNVSLEAGELTDDEFDDREAALMERLRIARSLEGVASRES